jgi:hypothetical protein
MLDKHRELIPVVFSEQWIMARSNTTHEVSDGVWTLARLKTAFRTLANQEIPSMKLCLIVDGLDKYHGRPCRDSQII